MKVNKLERVLKACQLTQQDETTLDLDDIHINVFPQYMTKDEYAAMETDIRKTIITRVSYKIYTWNDISGYEYWKNDGDGNYIQITVSIKNLKKLNIKQLKLDIDKIRDHFDSYDNIEEHIRTLNDNLTA